MITERDGRWFDDRGNYWATKELAEKHSPTMNHCFGCCDCSNCSDCFGCRDCSNCIECSDCYDCRDCRGCTFCSDCSACYFCGDCSACRGCYKCRYCHTCSFLRGEGDLQRQEASPQVFAEKIEKELNVLRDFLKAATTPNLKA